MRKIERAAFIVEYLGEIYPKTPIPLHHNNTFELLIAVLLSAQCTDERVNKVTPELFKLASGPQEMQKIHMQILRELMNG